MLFVLAIVLALTLQTNLALCQKLTVQAESGKQTVLARADIEALPHVKITTAASGVSATFEGVALKGCVGKSGSWVRRDYEGEADGFMFAGGGGR